MSQLSFFSFNANGPYPTRLLHGEEHWVVPFVSLVPGVLPGSKGPLYYSAHEVTKDVGSWNGIPVVNGHPYHKGRPVSAKKAAVLDTHQLGTIFNDHVEDGRRRGEAWIHKGWTRNRNPILAGKLDAGEIVEVSTGVKTSEVEVRNGRDDKGRSYWADAIIEENDHLAILTSERGACSIADGCGLGVNARFDVEDFTDNYDSQPGEQDLCPDCGGTMSGGKCTKCGKEYSDTDSTEFPDKGTRNWALNAFRILLNAFLPNQPRSKTTGRIKLPNAGTGAGDLHEVAQGAFHAFIPNEREAQLGQDAAAQAAAGQNPPNWAVDEELWEKAKGAAAKSGHDEDWPYVVGVYQRMGGEITGKDVQNKESNQGSGLGDPLEDDVMARTRKENIAFLVANCDCWKGKKELLSNEQLFDDKAISSLVANVERAQAGSIALNALKETAKAAGLPEDLAVNEMPEALKAAMEKKKGKDDDEEEEEEEEETANSRSKKVAPRRMTLEEFEATAPLEVVENARLTRTAVEREKQIVINRLTEHITDDKKRAERQKHLATLKLNELYDRAVDLPRAAIADRGSMARGDREPVYGGGDLERHDGPTYNEEDLSNPEKVELLDLPTVNQDFWNEGREDKKIGKMKGARQSA